MSIDISSEKAKVSIVPERGGIAARFAVGGRAIFFLDETTLADPTKNVRGGNPVLFPSPGPSKGNYEMKQHGFARDKAWRVAETKPSECTLVLAADESTRAQYPWDFALTYRYAVSDATLRIEQRFENRSAEPMPFAAGFHPYFHVPDAEKMHASVPTKATRAWDNVTKTNVDVAPISLSGKEVDLHLVDHGGPEAALVLRDGRVAIRCSPEFHRWVIWTLPGKDFVCLEPWTAAANALNTGESLLVVPPGGAKELFTEIAWVVGS